MPAIVSMLVTTAILFSFPDDITPLILVCANAAISAVCVALVAAEQAPFATFNTMIAIPIAVFAILFKTGTMHF